MRHTLVFLECLLAVLLLIPASVAHASDFSGLAYVALALIGGVAIACLFGGCITTLLVFGRKGRRETIRDTLVFSVCWFAAGWILMSAFGW